MPPEMIHTAFCIRFRDVMTGFPSWLACKTRLARPHLWRNDPRASMWLSVRLPPERLASIRRNGKPKRQSQYRPFWGLLWSFRRSCRSGPLEWKGELSNVEWGGWSLRGRYTARLGCRQSWSSPRSAPCDAHRTTGTAHRASRPTPYSPFWTLLRQKVAFRSPDTTQRTP